MLNTWCWFINGLLGRIWISTFSGKFVDTITDWSSLGWSSNGINFTGEVGTDLVIRELFVHPKSLSVSELNELHTGFNIIKLDHFVIS
jgi:hypothetical protein